MSDLGDFSGALTIGKLCDGVGITLKEFFDVPEFENIDKFE